MQEFLIAMENEVGEKCFYYPFNLWDIILWKQHLVGKIDICIHLGIMCGEYRIIYDLFIYCFSAKMEKKKNPTGTKHPQQVCKTGILFSISFDFENSSRITTVLLPTVLQKKKKTDASL